MFLDASARSYVSPRCLGVILPPDGLEVCDLQNYWWLWTVLDFTAFSGCAGVVAGHPLDTLKVRQQSFSDSNLSRLTINLVKNEGVSDDGRMIIGPPSNPIMIIWYFSCLFGIRSQLCSRECLTQCWVLGFWIQYFSGLMALAWASSKRLNQLTPPTTR